MSVGHRRTLTDSTGVTRDTIDPSGQLLVRTAPGGVKTYYIYGLGLLYEANATGETKTYHFDQVGSTIARTDDAGKLIGQADYNAYGITFWKTGDMATPFLYNGQAGVQTDSNGLLNMRARYYSPYLMRFLNADPSGFSGGSNWFAYADGNPISLNDPFGLCAESGGGFMSTLKYAGQAQMGNLTSAYNSVGNYLGWAANTMASDIHNGTQALGRQFPVLGEIENSVRSNMWMLDALGPAGAIETGVANGFKTISTLGSGLRASDEMIDVYRVFGGDARAQGFSWTSVDPRTVSNFRNAAGLPSGGASGATNTADFLVQGQAWASDIIKSRSALPLDGNAGGLLEHLIDPRNVKLNNFSILNP